MDNIPFVVFSNDELKTKKDIGQFATCPNCKQQHEVKYGDKVLEDGTTVPSKLLAYIKCPENNAAYLVGVNGKLI